MSSLSISNKVNHRRAAKACTSCHARKIRCDVLKTGIPCTKCQIHEFECTLAERKHRNRKVKKVVVGGNDAPNEEGAAVPQSLSAQVLHQVPHYSFLQNHIPCIRLQTQENSQEEVIFPVPTHDPSVSSSSQGKDSDANETSFLRSAGVYSLPRKEHLDKCITAYFQYFHPFFPVIAKSSFLHRYHQSSREELMDGQEVSILLLNVLISTACPYLLLQDIFEMGFSGHREARNTFHTRARLLHSLNHEPNDVATIQALLLMSHYYPSMSEQRHTWFWVYQAIGLAQGLGLHRAMDFSRRRNPWARLWWACVIRDRLIALGTGRPMHINSLDCDVPMLNRSDLEEDGDSEQDRQIKAIFVDLLKLCQCTEGVLSLSTAATRCQPADIDLCENMLGHWKFNLDPASRLPGKISMESDITEIVVVYQILLHLLYNTVKISLYERRNTVYSTYFNRDSIPCDEALSVASDSARILAQVNDWNIIDLLPTQSVTTILPPLIVHFSSMSRSKTPFDDQASNIAFDSCMHCLKRLGHTFWHAGFYHDLFKLAAQGLGTGSHRRLKNGIQALQNRSTKEKYYSSSCLSSARDSGLDTCHPKATTFLTQSKEVFPNEDQVFGLPVDYGTPFIGDEGLQYWLDDHGI